MTDSTLNPIEGGPFITLDANGAHIAPSENGMATSKSLERKNLSASLVSGLEGCHVRWLADSFVLGKIVPQDPDNAARRGNLFHKIMEEFFTLPQEERTKDNLNVVTNKVFDMEQFEDYKYNKDAIEWIKTAMRRYYAMGAHPERVKVAKFMEPYSGRDESKKGTIEEKIGLELFVKGKVGDTKRDILGFVDQLVVDQRDKTGETVIVQDWKSGAKAKQWNPNTRSDDGFAEARQQIIYSHLVEQTKGLKVSGARLIYPLAETVVEVDVKDDYLLNRTFSTVKEADEKLDYLIEQNQFEYKPGFLCAWCPLSRICPRAIIKPYAKMEAAYASQPDPEILFKGIEVL